MHSKAFQGGDKAPQELNKQRNEKHKENRDVSLFFFLKLENPNSLEGNSITDMRDAMKARVTKTEVKMLRRTEDLRRPPKLQNTSQ